MSSFKKGQKLTIKGEKLIVSSLNDDGTITLNYASGSGKTGFAGKIVNPDSIKSATSPKAVFVENIFPIEDSSPSISLEQYNYESDLKEKRVPSLLESFALQNNLSDGGVSDGEAIKTLELGVDRNKIIDAVTRLVGGTMKEPTKEQVVRRLKFLVAEKEFEDKYNEIKKHKFKMLTSPSDKRRFYQKAINDIQEAYDKANQSYSSVSFAEQPKNRYTSKNRHSSEYFYEQDWEKELDIPEKKSIERIYENYVSLTQEFTSKIRNLDASWV